MSAMTGKMEIVVFFGGDDNSSGEPSIQFHDAVLSVHSDMHSYYKADVGESRLSEPCLEISGEGMEGCVQYAFVLSWPLTFAH